MQPGVFRGYHALSPVSGEVLAERQTGNMTQTWEETLCIERLSPDEWRLVVAAPFLDIVDEGIPLDQAPNKRGKYPKNVTHLGRPVRFHEDGFWIYTDSPRPLVQYDDERCWIIRARDIDRALFHLRSDDWEEDEVAPRLAAAMKRT